MDKKVLDKVLSGLSDKNVRFQDLKKLLNDLGFVESEGYSSGAPCSKLHA